MKQFYKSHIIEVDRIGHQTVYDINENSRGRTRHVVGGFIHGDTDHDSLMIKLKARVDQMLLEPPTVIPSMWGSEWFEKHEEEFV